MKIYFTEDIFIRNRKLESNKDLVKHLGIKTDDSCIIEQAILCDEYAADLLFKGILDDDVEIEYFNDINTVGFTILVREKGESCN